MIGQWKGKMGLEVLEWEESKERGRPVDRGKWRKRRWKEDKENHVAWRSCKYQGTS